MPPRLFIYSPFSPMYQDLPFAPLGTDPTEICSISSIEASHSAVPFPSYAMFKLTYEQKKKIRAKIYNITITTITKVLKLRPGASAGGFLRLGDKCIPMGSSPKEHSKGRQTSTPRSKGPIVTPTRLVSSLPSNESKRGPVCVMNSGNLNQYDGGWSWGSSVRTEASAAAAT